MIIKYLITLKILCLIYITFFSEDILVSVCDREKYIKIDGAEKFGLTVKAGDFISNQGGDFEAIKTGKIIEKKYK